MRAKDGARDVSLEKTVLEMEKEKEQSVEELKIKRR